MSDQQTNIVEKLVKFVKFLSDDEISFEKIATVALWNGPPTPPIKIIAKEGI